MRLWALPVLVALAACGGAGDAGDEGDEVDQARAPLAEAGRLRVVQFNPFHGGRYPVDAYQQDSLDGLPVNYGTAKEFAKDLLSKYPDVAIIGTEEMDRPEDAQQMQAALGAGWKFARYGRPAWSGDDAPKTVTHEAIFWRSDVVEMIESFGTRQVGRYLKKSQVDAAVDAGKSVASLDPVSVRFAGAAFVKHDGARVFGFFTGKLTPRYQYSVKSTNQKLVKLDDGDKAAEVARLQKWIDKKMAEYPFATRIVTMDQNALYGSAPWKRMSRRFFDFEDEVATWQAPASLGGDWRRYDYVWWDYDAGGRRTDGFFDDPKTLGGTGSDHKAVIADVYVRALHEQLPGHACDVRCCNGTQYRLNANSDAACKDLWTVCRINHYTKWIEFNGDRLFTKQSCGG